MGITVKFCSIQSHQSNPAEHAIQRISNIIIHYITKYSNLWCIMPRSAWIFYPINLLQNLSSYEIVYGHKPPAIMDLQLEGDDLTRPTFYCFSDYLDLLQWMCTCYTWYCERASQSNLTKTISTTRFRESHTEIIQWGWYSLLSFSIKKYYLWPQTTFEKIANVLCWTIVHFL